MRETPDNFNNILVIDLGQLGDVVLSLPALKAIRDHFPGAKIAVIAGKVPDQVVRMSGLADEVIVIDRVALRDGPKLDSIRKIFKFVAEIRRRPVDLVIDLHSLPETNLLAYLSKAKYRLLANRESRSLDRLGNFEPRPPMEDKAKHLSERYLDVLRPLGIEDGEAEFILTPLEEDARAVSDKFFGEETLNTVGLFPGAGHPSRRWSLGKFVELAKRIENDGLRPAVFLGPEEAGLRAKVEDAFPETTIIIDGLSISQFVAAASKLAVFVTNDTGPMHLAALAGEPIVLLLDSRAPDTYLPLTKNIEIVQNEVIDNITVDDVYRAVAKSLATSLMLPK